jgi:hypothetical protein
MKVARPSPSVEPDYLTHRADDAGGTPKLASSGFCRW